MLPIFGNHGITTYNGADNTVTIYLCVSECVVWFASQAPYLIEQTPIAPDITGNGVFLVVECLWCCPFDWYQTTFRNVVPFISQVSRQAKISNLLKRIHVLEVYKLGYIRRTLQKLSVETRIFLAAKSLWTNPFPERYCIPRATCWEKLSRSLGRSRTGRSLWLHAHLSINIQTESLVIVLLWS